MSNLRISVLGLIAILTSSWTSGAETLSDCRPSNLRCEYLERPIGIDRPAPRLSWRIDDCRENATQTAYRIALGTDSVALSHNRKIIWEGKKKNGDLSVVYSGHPLKPFTRYYWSVTVWDKDGKKSQPVISSFETGFMDSGWKGAFISDGKDAETRQSSCFRRKINISKEIESARAYIAAAGLYELSLNGKKVGDHFLDPAFTNYDKRLLYVSYDVTDALAVGDNVIGIILGNGWYNHQPEAVWNFHNAPWRARPSFCLNLRLRYADGTEETVVSDSNFKVADSPLTFNAIYVAENYDFRKDMDGWDTARFDDSAWRAATELPSAPSGQIVSQAMHPIRITDSYAPVSVKHINDSVYLYDFGQNWAGITSFSVKGEAGTKVRLRHGEQLDSRGKRIFDDNHLQFYRNRYDADEIFQTDVLILDGRNDTFMPRFNYKGFRYVEVISDKPLELDERNMYSHFIHTDLPAIGSFECSDTLVNRLWKATNISYLSNLVGYPTDCPQREKNGWTGDAHLAVETGLLNYDGITLYEKWMADHRDDMADDGSLHCIIPSCGWSLGNLVDWTCSMTVIPWALYEYYGDTACLADNYEAMKRHTDFWLSKYPDGLIPDACLGDWVPHRAVANKELTASIYNFKNADIVAKSAAVLGHTSDADHYRTKAEIIKDAINKKFLDRETGIYASGCQTEQSMPLYWGVVPDDCKEKVAAQLSKRVTADKDHLDFGIMGCKTVMNALTESGQVEQAYRMVTQQDYPSWGNWLRQGATTLFENWDYNGLAAGYSQNHIMYGEIGAWLFKALAGINVDPENPGFKNILLRPHFVKDLDYVNASYTSPYGEIRSSWERKGDKVTYRITVPANSTATLWLDGNNTAKHLAAGTYEFEI